MSGGKVLVFVYTNLQECAHLRSENQTLTSEKNEADKMLNRHLLRLTALEQEVSQSVS